MGDGIAGGVEVTGDQEDERILAACGKAVEDRLLGRARAHAATIPCFFDAQMHNLNSENRL